MPQDTAAISQLHAELESSRLDSNGDPLALFARLNTIRARLSDLGEPRGLQSVLLDFLALLPSEYDQEVRRLRTKDSLTVAKVEKLVRARYEDLKSSRCSSSKALSARVRARSPARGLPASGGRSSGPPGTIRVDGPETEY